MHRPIGLTAIAIYHLLFSAVLLATLVWQGIAHPPIDGWLDAAPVLLMLLFLSLIPAVLSYGLWIMDEGARIGALVFTILHLLSTVIYLQHAFTLWRPWVRAAMDVIIIAVLLLPSIRAAFREESKFLFDGAGPA